MTEISKKPMVEIAPLRAEDYRRWKELARSYNAFYKVTFPDSKYDEVWDRLLNSDGIFGLGAYVQGNLVGITHYLFHRTIWEKGEYYCYLRDLYVDETARGLGVARALIERVAQEARAYNVSNLYWQTHQDNVTARTLYDKVAHHSGFIVYDYPL